MKPFKTILILAIGLAAGAAGTFGMLHFTGSFGGHTPYAGQDARVVKAFSADKVAGLREGRGLGYAKSAELNGWEGPLHVLELKGEMKLTPRQEQQIEAIRQSMLARARPLGERLIVAEQRLDALFQSESPSADAVEQAVAEIAAIEAQLRASHLVAHLETAPLLNPEQRKLYQEKRGYGHGHHAGH